MFDRAVRAVFRPCLLGILLLGTVGCMQRIAVDAPPRSVLFFTVYSADLDDQANQVISEVAADARASPNRTVIVRGYADPLGAPATNRTLSRLRAQVVADALVAKGVDRGHIALRARDTADNDPGIESRRVEVSFGR